MSRTMLKKTRNSTDGSSKNPISKAIKDTQGWIKKRRNAARNSKKGQINDYNMMTEADRESSKEIIEAIKNGEVTADNIVERLENTQVFDQNYFLSSIITDATIAIKEDSSLREKLNIVVDAVNKVEKNIKQAEAEKENEAVYVGDDAGPKL